MSISLDVYTYDRIMQLAHRDTGLKYDTEPKKGEAFQFPNLILFVPLKKTQNGQLTYVEHRVFRCENTEPAGPDPLETATDYQLVSELQMRLEARAGKEPPAALKPDSIEHVQVDYELEDGELISERLARLEKERDKARSECGELTNSLRRMEFERSTLWDAKEQAEKEKKDLGAANAALYVQIDNLKEQCDGLLAGVETLKGQRNSLLERVEKAQSTEQTDAQAQAEKEPPPPHIRRRDSQARKEAAEKGHTETFVLTDVEGQEYKWVKPEGSEVWSKVYVQEWKEAQAWEVPEKPNYIAQKDWEEKIVPMIKARQRKSEVFEEMGPNGVKRKVYWERLEYKGEPRWGKVTVKEEQKVK